MQTFTQILTVQAIIGVFSNFRMNPLVNDEFDTKGKQVLEEKLLTFVVQNKPIKFSIMGFPMKSPNDRDKVIGNMTDLAEEITLKNFEVFNQAVKVVYPPGISVSIISDGFAFNDVMQVTDRVVEQYQEISMDMSKDMSINWFNLKDFYDKKITVDSMRTKLIDQFGSTTEELEHRILFDQDVNMLYKGMIRFMNLDIAIRDFNSKTQLQKAAKIMARTMMFRNEAYSKLVQSEFSDHIRLSMHPSINNGTKFSFQLIRSEHAWTSAWHCALMIREDGQFETIHRKDAELRGLELIYNNNQPYYYQQ